MFKDQFTAHPILYTSGDTPATYQASLSGHSQSMLCLMRDGYGV